MRLRQMTAGKPPLVASGKSTLTNALVFVPMMALLHFMNRAWQLLQWNALAKRAWSPNSFRKHSCS